MNQKPRLLIVGSINRDIIFYQPEAMELQKNGQLAFANYEFYNGGKAANQAVVAKKLGIEPVLVGAVGKDSDGDSMIRELTETGVDTRFVKQLEGVHTGLTTILTMPDSSYFSTNVRGGNDYITPEMVREAMDAQDIDMLLMQLEMPLETVYGAYKLAQERNIPVVLDAGPPQHLDMSRLNGIFMISPNEAETEGLTGIPVPDDESALRAARRLQSQTNARYVLLKLGGRGAFLLDGDRSASFPAFKIDCVDTTAAGDTFTTALAKQLCLGYSIEDSIRYANAAGALCVSRKGGLISVPDAEEVDKFLEQHRED